MSVPFGKPFCTTLIRRKKCYSSTNNKAYERQYAQVQAGSIQGEKKGTREGKAEGGTKERRGKEEGGLKERRGKAEGGTKERRGKAEGGERKGEEGEGRGRGEGRQREEREKEKRVCASVAPNSRAYERQ